MQRSCGKFGVNFLKFCDSPGREGLHFPRSPSFSGEFLIVLGLGYAVLEPEAHFDKR